MGKHLTNQYSQGGKPPRKEDIMTVQIFGSKTSLKGFNPVKVNNGMRKCFEVEATEEIYQALVKLAKAGKFQIVGVENSNK